MPPAGHEDGRGLVVLGPRPASNPQAGGAFISSYGALVVVFRPDEREVWRSIGAPVPVLRQGAARRTPGS